MKPALPLLVLLAAATACPALARDPAKLNPASRNAQLNPGTADKTITPDKRAPGVEVNQTVQGERFTTPETSTKETAAVQDKRAAVDVTETREKKIVPRKDAPKPEVRDRVDSRYDGQQSRIQPKGDAVKKYSTVQKYQGRMADAANAAAQRSPTVEKQTSFEKLNRFVFRRNGRPGTDGGPPVVTKAANEPPPEATTTTPTQGTGKPTAAKPAH